MSILPANWEEFKKFMLRDDVATPNKPLLSEQFRFYELGYSRKFPPEWGKYVELQTLRKTPIYEQITRAEETIGKYNGRVTAKMKEEPPPPPTIVNKKPKLK
jgi:hypothetical protein